MLRLSVCLAPESFTLQFSMRTAAVAADGIQTSLPVEQGTVHLLFVCLLHTINFHGVCFFYSSFLSSLTLLKETNLILLRRPVEPENYRGDEVGSFPAVEKFKNNTASLGKHQKRVNISHTTVFW